MKTRLNTETVSQLNNVIREYKTARENRNSASARNDLGAVTMYNDELTYWAEQLSATMKAENVEMRTVQGLLK
jgi:hypothetical protein